MTIKTFTIIEKVSERLPEIGGGAGAAISAFFDSKLGTIAFAGILAITGSVAGYLAKLALDLIFLKFKKRKGIV